MPRRDELSKRYGRGEHVIALPPPASKRFAVAKAVFSVESWQERDDLFEVLFERSIDDGVSWLRIGSAVCGPGVDHDGNPLTEVFVRFSVLDGATRDRQDQDGEVRIRIAAQVPFRSAVSVETLEKSELPPMGRR